jgi:MFS family permease
MDNVQKNTTAAPSADASTAGGYRFRWWVLAVMLTAEIMDLLDATIVNVAGPSFAKELGASNTDLQWIIGGYTLSLGAGLILGGRLGDRYGRRNMFLFGLITFTVASLLCAIAPTTSALIVFRLIQGFMGAMLLPQGFGLLRASFAPADLGKAFAVFGPVFGLGGILGPVIGGALIQADIFGLGWRSVFLVNLPLGIAATIIALRILPKTPKDPSIKIDLLGAFIVAVSSVLLLTPLIQGQPAGWPTWTWVSLIAAFAGFYLFVLQQRAILRRGSTPLIDSGIFKKRDYTVGLGGIFLFFAGMTGIYLVITLLLQLGAGFSAGAAGVGNIPIALGSAIGGALSGAVLADKLGRSVLQVGALVQTLGAIILWFTLGDLATFSIWHIVPGMVIAGIGTGLVVAALFDVVLSSADNSEVGSASGVLSAVQSIASSVGVAVFATVFFSAVEVGKIADGFRNALLVQLGLLLAFLLLSPLFPKKAQGD